MCVCLCDESLRAGCGPVMRSARVARSRSR